MRDGGGGGGERKRLCAGTRTRTRAHTRAQTLTRTARPSHDYLSPPTHRFDPEVIRKPRRLPLSWFSWIPKIVFYKEVCV